MAGAGWGCWDQGSLPNLFPARMLSLYVPLEISFPRGLHLQGLKHHRPWRDHLQEWLAQGHVFKNTHRRGFPGGQVIRTLCFHCRGCGFHSWLGNLDPTCCTRIIKPQEKPYLGHLMYASPMWTQDNWFSQECSQSSRTIKLSDRKKHRMHLSLLSYML